MTGKAQAPKVKKKAQAETTPATVSALKAGKGEREDEDRRVMSVTCWERAVCGSDVSESNGGGSFSSKEERHVGDSWKLGSLSNHACPAKEQAVSSGSFTRDVVRKTNQSGCIPSLTTKGASL